MILDVSLVWYMMCWVGWWYKRGLNIRLTAGGTVATRCNEKKLTWSGGLEWSGGKKKRKKNRKSTSRLKPVKESEMILPSVLSEASSLVAEKERECGRKKKREETEGKDRYKWLLKVKDTKGTQERGNENRTESVSNEDIMKRGK